LSVEEQFYLCFAPLLLMLAVRMRARGIDRLRLSFRNALIVVGMLSFATCLFGLYYAPRVLRLIPIRYWVYVGALPTVMFYGLPTRAWEFALGGLAVFYTQRATPHSGIAPRLMGLASLSALCAAVFLIPEHASHPGFTTLVPTLATVMLLVSGTIAPSSVVPRFLGTSPMRALGRLSYSWYLWHWPMLAFLAITFPQASIQLRAAVAMISLGPAAATYAWLESPVRHSRWLLARRKATLVGAAGLSLTVFAIAYAVKRHAQGTLRTEPFASIEAARLQRPLIRACDGLTPRELTAECAFGASTSDTTVLLIGDSHARHWFPAVEHVAQRHSWRLLPLTRAGCTMVRISASTAADVKQKVCDQWQDSLVRELPATKARLIILSNLAPWDVTVPTAAIRSLYRQRLIELLGALSRSGARVILLRDTPYPAVDIPDCLESHAHEVQLCDFSRSDAVRTIAPSLERAAVREVPRTIYLDLTEDICGPSTCPAMKNGVVRYHDFSHLSVAFARALGPALDGALSAALRKTP
jgi:hypothetical protein